MQVLFLIEEQNAQVAESVDVPKLLGDLFESIAAAIYLDSGKNLQLVWNVYFNLMKKEIGNISFLTINFYVILHIYGQ